MTVRKNVLLILLLFGFTLYGQDGFIDIFDTEIDESVTIESQYLPFLKIDMSGKAGLVQDFFFDQGAQSDRIVRPRAQLNLRASTPAVQTELKLDLKDKNDLKIDEFYIRGFFSLGYLDAGFMKREWGKGDGFHVVDPLNPLDQSEGIKSDLNEMKQSEFMLVWNQYLGESALLELVYKPFYHSLKTSSEDRWAVTETNLLPNIQPIPGGEHWEYTQLAARLSGTLLRLDGGLIYYYGYFSEPGLRIIVDPNTYIPVETQWIYTKAQLIGAEAAGVLGPLTVRGELGYWLSEDRTGSIEYLYNDRLSWLGGVDFRLGSHFFMSLQEYGHYIMNFTGLSEQDVNRSINYNNQPSVNSLIVSLEGNFFNETINLRISGITLLGTQGYLIMPELSWLVSDNWELALKVNIFDGEPAGANPYHAWRKNDFLSLQINMLF